MIRQCHITRKLNAIKRNTHTCKRCGKEYIAKAKERITYCSRECYYADKAEGKVSRRKSEKKKVYHKPIMKKYHRFCIECGNEINYKKGRIIAWSKFCSEKCRQIYAYKENKSDGYEKNRKCKLCGVEFAREKLSGLPTEYCSSECLSLSKKKNERIYKKTVSARRRSRMREIQTERIDIDVIIERHAGRCAICGKKVLNDKKAPHPKSPSIDHIIPIACGGNHTYNNVQLAHFICNSLKGTSILPSGEQLWLI